MLKGISSSFNTAVRKKRRWLVNEYSSDRHLDDEIINRIIIVRTLDVRNQNTNTLMTFLIHVKHYFAFIPPPKNCFKSCLVRTFIGVGVRRNINI